MTAVLTILPLLLWFAMVLPTCRKEAGSGLLSKGNSVSLKGLCSVVIIYVHIPALFGNTLQDAVGSFAYICVTLFFCYSAYGMTLNVEKKDDYLRCFWRNRLASLLVPCLLVNVAAFLTDLSVNRNPDFRILYETPMWLSCSNGAWPFSSFTCSAGASVGAIHGPMSSS